MRLKRFYTKAFFVIISPLLLTVCTSSQDSQSRYAYKKLHKKYVDSVDIEKGITNSQLKKWETKFWNLRREYPNTTGGTKGTIEAYRLAVKVKDVATLDTLFQQISIHEDALAEILRYLPYTPIYDNAIPNLREIINESNNSKVRASALLQSAKVHQNHRRYGQVAVILDSLSEQYNITTSHQKYGLEIEKLYKNINEFSVGQKLDEFETTTLEGQEFSSENFKENVTLIYFYNTGCGSCVAMLPTLNGLFEKYRDDNFRMLGVSADSVYLSQKEFRNELKEHSINWPQTLELDLFYKYKVNKVSTIFLVNKNQELVLTSLSENITETIPKLKGLSLEQAIQKVLNDIDA